jgi:two-component system chemotaxis sensor kinase CheA
MQQALRVFTVESHELLDEMEAALLAGGGGGDGDGDGEGSISSDGINAVFRAAHTIKGSAGLFGLDHIVAFTHVVEGVLDRARDGSIAFDTELTSLMLACGDHIRMQVEAVDGGQAEADQALAALGEPLLHSLAHYLPAADGGAAPAAPAAPSVPASPAGGIWHISLRFGPDVLRNGMDPMSFLRYLETMGRLVRVALVDDAVPALDRLDPETCYLGLEIVFESGADHAAIDGAFDFVRDDCRIHIIAPGSGAASYAGLIEAYPEQAVLLGELFALGARAPAPIAAPQPAAPGAAAAPPAPPAPPAVEAAAPERRQRDARATDNTSVRVDAAKLDHLINLVGELIVATASAGVIGRRTGDTELQECVSNLAALVEDVRDGALQLRMVKIGATFKRFQRVVHDVARDLGKRIDLVISGEDTELDKTVVEKIADPLTHLVRNAIDHGIEPAALRAERGKPATGTISLNAYHDSGTIVIEVHDDGGGLKRDRILAKAIERGIVEPGKALTDDEIHALIFEPGFSTAEQITNLSGRGVGMDVVKRNIVALRGSIAIDSTEGAGTTVTVRLPLTLAIIDGFQVAVGRSVFVLPLEMVEECVAFVPAAGHDYADLRGKVLPFIRLDELFRIPGRSGARRSLVVVRYAGQRAGLVVDGLLGEAQTVIKPLGKVFQHLQCVSGSSILGSGEIALILDVPALIRQAGGDAARTNQAHEPASA